MAGWLIHNLGYGQWAIVDSENPTTPPTVTATVTAPSFDSFTRIMQNQFTNDEEVRLDKPSNYLSSFEYIALAPAGSATSDLVWDCVRCTWINNKKVRYQFRTGISWDQHIAGWS